MVDYSLQLQTLLNTQQKSSIGSPFNLTQAIFLVLVQWQLAYLHEGAKAVSEVHFNSTKNIQLTWPDSSISWVMYQYNYWNLSLHCCKICLGKLQNLQGTQCEIFKHHFIMHCIFCTTFKTKHPPPKRQSSSVSIKSRGRFLLSSL